MSEMNVVRWVELFDAIGVENAAQHRWHVEFERRYPEGHRSFLEWLGLDAARIAEIRTSSKTAAG